MVVPLFNALFLRCLAISHIIETKFFGCTFFSQKYRFNFNHSDVIGPQATELSEITQITAINRSRSFTAINFGTNGKLLCAFL